MSRRWPALWGALAVCLVVFILQVLPVSAAQPLANGGFEQGMDEWLSSNVETDCPPHSGAGAARMQTDADSSSNLRQAVHISAAGSYSVTGFLMQQSGTTNLTLTVTWKNANGDDLRIDRQGLGAGASYADFQFTMPSSAANAAAVVIKFEGTSSGPASLCFDDLALQVSDDGVATATASASATASPSPTATTSAPGQGTPSQTPTVPSANATAKPTSTATKQANTGPTSTPEPGFSFINGDFEQGLAGWQKFGGELRLTTAANRSGRNAGVLSSSTDSTKWAYQAVRIDPATAYEFSGYVRAGDGAAAAYLRISWYASNDASGKAIATDDSMTTITSPGGDFVLLSTGAIAPPESARSARLRAVLEPASAAPASIFLDDFSFAIATIEAAAPSTGTTAVDEVVEAPASASTTEPQAQGDTPAEETATVLHPASASSTSGDRLSITPVSEVAGSRAASSPAPDRTKAPLVLDKKNTEPAKDRHSPWIYLGIPVGFLGAAGAYHVYSRRRPH